jgi:hypothetical protein
MNNTIEQMFSEAEGRYLEPTEQSALTQYASSLEARLAAMRAIQEHESTIIENAVKSMFAAYPDAKQKHKHVQEKAVRDMTLVLRYCAMSMVRDSTEFLENQLLHWFRTIILSFEMQQMVEHAYAQLIEEAKGSLDAAHFELIAPYLEITHNALKA